ncbi:hypothetical protein [Bradyrhizobium valentinum]|jgi:hypothetical protein|uniref:hypothetical protein n=1 Tax=Bradyrhizobium valentinum TaxID=1518501 RepID=UPI000710FF9F|nr:hypothetical protein [Bradyrhizobium valentinum]KRR00085.1 hypothetical protein CQ10_23765 [Bradyrhizobium valentinum]
MERSVFEVVKAPLGWSVFADNVKIGGVYDSRGAALEAAVLAASYTVSDGGGVQINVPGAEEEKPRWAIAFDIASSILPTRNGRERGGSR